jgi:hypothetical protein
VQVGPGVPQTSVGIEFWRHASNLSSPSNDGKADAPLSSPRHAPGRAQQVPVFRSTQPRPIRSPLPGRRTVSTLFLALTKIAPPDNSLIFINHCGASSHALIKSIPFALPNPMNKLARLLSFGIMTALLTTGCATLTKGPRQNVQIESAPRGATVIVNGNVVGETPMNISLSRQRAHEIVIERAGYRPEEATLLTVPNEASEAFIRFGIDRHIGAHNDLTPSHIQVELTPLILPERAGPNPVSELAGKVLEVDELLYQGQIDADEHRYLVTRLLRFYQAP